MATRVPWAKAQAKVARYYETHRVFMSVNVTPWAVVKSGRKMRKVRNFERKVLAYIVCGVSLAILVAAYFTVYPLF